MVTRLNPKEEFMVLTAIREKGEATLVEIAWCIKEKWNTEIDTKKLVRYARRWKKRKVIAVNMINNDWVYSARDIPWWPEAQMIHVVKPDTSDAEATEFLANYEGEIKKRGYVTDRKPDIRNYKAFKIVMEAIDTIAGGELTNDEDKVLIFPRSPEGKLMIPRSWLIGLIRDNARLINMTTSIKYNLAVSPGHFTEKPKTKQITVIGKKGPQTHEVVMPGAQFEFMLSYPMHGTPIKSEDDLRNFLKKIETMPIRGLGTYDKRFGGRVKVVEMTKI